MYMVYGHGPQCSSHSYKELWEKLESLIRKHKVKWEWVKGHSGDAENERADELARKGIQDII